MERNTSPGLRRFAGEQTRPIFLFSILQFAKVLPFSRSEAEGIGFFLTVPPVGGPKGMSLATLPRRSAMRRSHRCKASQNRPQSVAKGSATRRGRRREASPFGLRSVATALRRFARWRVTGAGRRADRRWAGERGQHNRGTTHEGRRHQTPQTNVSGGNGGKTTEASFGKRPKTAEPLPDMEA